jgi:hypothetical protein
MGGKDAGWKPMVMHHEGGTHWFLKRDAHNSLASDWIIDPTVSQFKTKPDYTRARGCGFLTKKPSKRAKKLMGILLYRKEF